MWSQRSIQHAALVLAALAALAPSLAAAPAPASQPRTVKKPAARYEGWQLRISLRRADLALKNTLQGLWTQTEQQGDESRNTTELRRARSELSGWLFSERLTFEAQVDWKELDLSGLSDLDSGGAAPDRIELRETVQDLFLNWDLSGDERAQLRLGQFKTPFGRQELTSAGKQGMVDRSLVTDEFAGGRDVGVMVWGWVPDWRLEYFAGVFNGQGKNELDNAADRYQTNLRLVYQPFGKVKYEEGDFQWQAGPPLLALAGGFERNDGRAVRRGTLEATTFALDATLKWRGLFAFVETFAREQRLNRGPRIDGSGAQLQLGFFVWKRHLELSARLAELDPDDEAAGDRRQEQGLGLGYYLREHDLKVQADYREVELGGAPGRRQELRVQGQVRF